MIGHRQIVAARIAKRKPESIFFDLGPAPVMPRTPCAPTWQRLREATYHPEHALDALLFPTVFDVDAADDLRFACGCRCHVEGPAWSPKLIALGYALADAGASMVIVSAIADSDDLMVFHHDEWTTR